ncbi:hypothetical protein ES703_115743 [subsurface metagenome]
MSAKVFVLIETEVGKINKVVATLKGIEGVKTADCVTGPYDVIAVIERESLNDIGDLVTGKIQSIAGISRTVVCLARQDTASDRE